MNQPSPANEPIFNYDQSLLRYEEDVDLTKAKQSCKRCHGVGLVGHLLKDDKRIPLICRCVVRNGGVRDGSTVLSEERMVTSTADQIVGAALRLPHAMLPMAIRSIEKLQAELPLEQQQSARALAFAGARRVLVQRMMAQSTTQGAAPEETP